MAKEGTPRFEIPADMRALAEKSVEQAKQAFDISFQRRNTPSARRKIRRPLCKRVPRKLANWRWGSPTSWRYVNSQIAALTEQGKELGERVAKMTGHGSKR